MRNYNQEDVFAVELSLDFKAGDQQPAGNIPSFSTSVEAAIDPIGLGDIVFTAYESDSSTANGKYFEFVLLTDVAAGSSIYFTDNGYRTDTGTFRTIEEFLRWTAQTDLPAGTKVAFLLENDGANAASAEWTNVTYFGTESTVAAINFSTSGDQIHAFIDPVFGSYDSLGGTPIASLDASGGYVAPYTDTGSANQTGLPGGLSVGVTAIAIGNFDNGRYAGTLTGTPDQIRAAVNDVTNWLTSNLSMNTPAFTQHLAGDAADYLENSAAVFIDVDQNSLLFDDSFNMNNGELTIAISSGKSAAQDELGIVTGGTVSVVAGTVRVNGVAIGTVTGGGAGGGDLVVTFATSGVTAAAVQELLRNISYRNTSDAPSTAQRTITTTLVDGDFQNNAGYDTMAVTTAMNVTAVNDEPAGSDTNDSVAVNDVLVFTAADFSTGMTDPEGHSFAGVKFTTLPANGTLKLNGIAISAGATVTLAQLDAGQLTYWPAAGSSGNWETFTFQVQDNGGTANGGVDFDQTPNTFTINVTSDDGEINGTPGDDTLVGTPDADFFDLNDGGDDNASGLGGNDGFYFGAALNSGDFVDGGEGSDDQVALQGNYAGGVTLTAANFPGVETFALLPGNNTAFGDPGTNFYDYNVTTLGSFGRNIIVNGNQLRVGEDFTFNGAAETTGSFTFFGGFGTENLTGGSRQRRLLLWSRRPVQRRRHGQWRRGERQSARPARRLYGRLQCVWLHRGADQHPDHCLAVRHQPSLPRRGRRRFRLFHHAERWAGGRRPAADRHRHSAYGQREHGCQRIGGDQWHAAFVRRRRQRRADRWRWCRSDLWRATWRHVDRRGGQRHLPVQFGG